MDPRKLRGLGATAIARALFRKFVFRRVEMGFYVVTPDTRIPFAAEGYETRLVAGCDVEGNALANPNVDEIEFLKLSQHPGSHCVLVSEDGVVVASNWYLRGTIHVTELDRAIDLPEGTHYSCRTFVHPDQRGKKLMAHMANYYLETASDCLEICGLIFDSNTASVAGVTKAGWERRGSLRALRVLHIRRPVRFIS